MKFDLNKIVSDCPSQRYSIRYITYKEEDSFDTMRTLETLKKDIETGVIEGRYVENICFSTFPSGTKAGSNRILFKVDFEQCTKISLHLTRIERKRWVNLCRYYGLMPNYIGKHFIDTGNFILRFDDLTLSKIYMMLTAARYMQESPQTVRAVIYLRKRGFNFFLSLLIATRCTHENAGHSIFVQTKPYMASLDNKLSQVAIDPREALALKMYIEQKQEANTEPFSEFILRSGYKNFSLQNTIYTIKNKLNWKIDKIKIADLFSREVQDRFKPVKTVEQEVEKPKMELQT